MKRRVWLLTLVFALLLIPAAAQAQNIDFKWKRWDSFIDVQPANNALSITETQEFVIFEGPVRFGSRTWTQPVEIQAVYIVVPEDTHSPTELTYADSEEPGTYFVSQTDDETELKYYLPRAVNGGESFIAQINYTAPLATAGLVDWKVIPGEHAAPIDSSTVTINFPSGGAPGKELVRIASGSGDVEQNGNSFIIRSQGPIAENQIFAIQAPFGEGVGAAGAPAGGAPPENPAPREAPQKPSGGIQISNTCLLGLVCGVMLLLLLGGGGLLRNLVPTLTPGAGTPRYPGAGNAPQPIPRSRSRGFTRSANQRRRLPGVGRRKDSGGSSGLG